MARKQYGTPAYLVVWPLEEALPKFRAMTPEERARIRFIRGHFRYGFHEEVARPCVYVTLLRDPVERILSLFRYIRVEPRHPQHRVVVEERLDLGAFLERKMVVPNEQTWFLSGSRKAEPARMSQTDLRAAKRNLRRFKAFGLTERYEDSMRLIGRALHWSPIEYRSFNASPPLAPDEVPPGILERLEAENAMDRQLYRYAKRLFRTRLLTRPISLRRRSERSGP
jgi:hypothetical protein